MVKDFSGSDLFKRLDAANREREQVYEQANQVSADRLTRNLTAINETALATYANAIRFWTTWMNVGGVAGWLILIGLSLGLGIYGAHKLAIRWTEWEVQSLTSRKAALQAEIEAQKTTIKQLKTKTGGILLYEEESGRYVVFPKGQFGDDGTDWTFGGRPALKLKNQ